jgi:hypothetical protein
MRTHARSKCPFREWNLDHFVRIREAIVVEGALPVTDEKLSSAPKTGPELLNK